MRIKITLQYNGVPFFGSQSQKNTKQTVLGIFQSALSRLGISAKAIASGRTDRAVHASGQVVHCDLPTHWKDLKKLRRSLDLHLPETIRIRHLVQVDDDFHARYSAKRRVYRYVLSDKEPNPFENDFVTFTKKIDIEVLNSAIKTFIGTHDFTSFKKNGSDTGTNVRIIYKAFAYEYRGKTILYFEANGYLRSQIRMMVGFLLEINEGRLDVDRLKEQLLLTHLHHRTPAPPNGLYLAKVKYLPKVN